MVQIDVIYEGGLRCTATHGPSGQTLQTDAPVDNHGKGETFSPTDLVATALATCIPTTMGIYAERHDDIDLTGMKVQVRKIMTAEPPRRIARLELEIDMPISADRPQSQALERVAHTCPVHRSLLSDVEIDVQFRWLE